MNGIPGYIATLITDSHYVSSESMSAFEPVLAQIGIQSTACDVKKIDKRPRFKELLKEANQRGNAIFSWRFYFTKEQEEPAYIMEHIEN